MSNVFPGTMLLKYGRVSELPGGLGRIQTTEPHPQSIWSAGLQWDQRSRISNKLPGNAGTAGPDTTAGEPLSKSNFKHIKYPILLRRHDTANLKCWEQHPHITQDRCRPSQVWSKQPRRQLVLWDTLRPLGAHGAGPVWTSRGTGPQPPR